MKYEEKDYIEDLKISRYVFDHWFSSCHALKDDLIQESIVALWRARPKFKNENGSYSTFAVTVSNNAMKLFLRKENRFVHEELPCELVDNSMDIDFRLDLFFRVSKRLDSLSRKQRIVVEMLDLLVAGYRQREIAKKMNLSSSYVCWCLRKFREAFDLDMLDDFGRHVKGDIKLIQHG